MKKIITFLIVFVAINIFSTTEVENVFLGFAYKNNPYLKHGYHTDSQISFGGVNDYLNITLSYSEIIPKKYVKITYPVQVHTVKTDSVFYHDVWVDNTYYETLVYDTTFVDTTFTVLDTVKTEQNKIKQMEIFLKWTHRQFLWYYYGLATKFAFLNDSQFLLSGIFHQSFNKTFKKFRFVYENSFIATDFKTFKYEPQRIKIFDKEIINTTADSLYQFEPDSVLTYIYTDKTFDVPKKVSEDIQVFQYSHSLLLNYKKLYLTLSHSFLKDKEDFRNYYKTELLFEDFLYSLDLIYFWGNPYLMHDFDYRYFNTLNEDMKYGVYLVGKVFPLDRKRYFKFGVAYNKYEKMEIRGVLFGFGLNF